MKTILTRSQQISCIFMPTAAALFCELCIRFCTRPLKSRHDLCSHFIQHTQHSLLSLMQQLLMWGK